MADGGPRGRWDAILVFAALVVVYALTAQWGTRGQTTDVAATIVGAHAIGTTGSPAVSAEVAARFTWMVETEAGFVPGRFPGAMFLAAPLYALARQLSFAPGTAVAVLSAAGGAALAGFSLRPAHGRRAAVTGALLVGFGTSTWGVASQTLWSEGPMLLWLGFAAFAMSRDRFAWAGVALGAGVLTRFPLIVVPLVCGAHIAWSRRSLHPLRGLSAALWGVVAYVGYNRAVFGSWSLVGGYRSADHLLFRYGPSDYPYLLAGGLVSPARGVLLQTPLLVAAARSSAWRRAPDWLRALALGMAVYTLATWVVDGYGGGAAQFVYRHALGGASVLTLVAVPWLLDTGRSWAVGTLVGVSVGVQAMAAFASGPSTVTQETLTFLRGDWPDLSAAAAVIGVLTATGAGMAVVSLLRRHRATAS